MLEPNSVIKAPSPGAAILDWVTKECSVRPDDLASLLEDPDFSMEAAAGVFWQCQIAMHDLRYALEVVARPSVDSGHAHPSGILAQAAHVLKRPSDVMQDTLLAKYVGQSRHMGPRVLLGTDGQLDLPRFFGQQSRHAFLGQCILETLEESLLAARPLLASDPAGKDPAEVVLLAAGLATLLVQLARYWSMANSAGFYYSEDLRDCIEIGRMGFNRIERPYVWNDDGSNPESTYWTGTELAGPDLLGFSLSAASCVVNAEWAALKASEGDYEEAFTTLDQAAYNLSNLGLFWSGLDIPHLMSPFGFVADGDVQYPSAACPGFLHCGNASHGAGVSPGIREMMNWYEALCESREKVRNWKKVAFSCHWFGRETLVGEGFAEVEISTGTLYSADDLRGYWDQASAFSLAQLSPSQLSEELQRRDQLQAQERLQRDFFEDCWACLDTASQQCLISAERTWYDAPSTGGRLPSALNEWRLALENELRQVLIVPLQSVFEEVFAEPEEKRRFGLDSYDPDSIGLLDLSTLLRRVWAGSPNVQGLDDHVAHLAPEKWQNRFLSRDFPVFLDRLRRARNRAEHELKADLVEMRQLRREILGIGCRGVLPFLMGIKKTALEKGILKPVARQPGRRAARLIGE